MIEVDFELNIYIFILKKFHIKLNNWCQSQRCPVQQQVIQYVEIDTKTFTRFILDI